MTCYAIFGANAAIAEHTAYALAEPGARFFLVGRNPEKLERVAASLRDRGVEVHAAMADLAIAGNHAALIGQAMQQLGMIDCALIAYGSLTQQERAEQDAAYAAAEINVNFNSPAALTALLARNMARRGGGHIAVITSVAGDRVRSNMAYYASAKAGLSSFLPALHQNVKPKGIGILDIRPGYVDTPMIRGRLKHNFLWASPQKVGMAIAKAMRSRRTGIFYVPCFWRPIMFLVRHMPAMLLNRIKM